MLVDATTIHRCLGYSCSAQTLRGAYFYCRVQGKLELSPLEVGEGNLNLEP